MKSETGKNVTNVVCLLETIHHTDSILDLFHRKILDEDQRSTLQHIAELVAEAQSAAWYLADTLDPCD